MTKPRLKVHEIGALHSVMDDREVVGVLLTGPIEEIRKVAAFLGEEVEIGPVTKRPRPEKEKP